MKRVLCTNTNATSPINGIEFLPIVEGLLSVPLEDADAIQFDGIGKYFSVLDMAPGEATNPEPALPTLEDLIGQDVLPTKEVAEELPPEDADAKDVPNPEGQAVPIEAETLQQEQVVTSEKPLKPAKK